MSSEHTTNGELACRRANRSVATIGFAMALIACVSGIFCISGCGGPVKRAVTGSVTLDGKPLEEAVILFVPLDGNGRKTGAQISAGRYEVLGDVGLLPGRYRVEVADDPPIDPAARPGSLSKPSHRRQIPVAYSLTSPLAIDTAVSSESVFDFALTSQPSPTP
jgi:hypothetical protein